MMCICSGVNTGAVRAATATAATKTGSSEGTVVICMVVQSSLGFSVLAKPISPCLSQRWKVLAVQLELVAATVEVL